MAISKNRPWFYVKHLSIPEASYHEVKLFSDTNFKSLESPRRFCKNQSTIKISKLRFSYSLLDCSRNSSTTRQNRRDRSDWRQWQLHRRCDTPCRSTTTSYQRSDRSRFDESSIENTWCHCQRQSVIIDVEFCFKLKIKRIRRKFLKFDFVFRFISFVFFYNELLYSWYYGLTRKQSSKKNILKINMKRKNVERKKKEEKWDKKYEKQNIFFIKRKYIFCATNTKHKQTTKSIKNFVSKIFCRIFHIIFLCSTINF